MASVLEILPACVSLTALEFRCVSALFFHLSFFPCHFAHFALFLRRSVEGTEPGAWCACRTSCNRPSSFTLVVFIFRICLAAFLNPQNYLLSISYLARHRRI
jgi:hypothetical protein